MPISWGFVRRLAELDRVDAPAAALGDGGAQQARAPKPYVRGRLHPDISSILALQPPPAEMRMVVVATALVAVKGEKPAARGRRGSLPTRR